jgi:hypothetical protein
MRDHIGHVQEQRRRVVYAFHVVVRLHCRRERAGHPASF